jgi:cAMP phosphodiesterase
MNLQVEDDGSTNVLYGKFSDNFLAPRLAALDEPASWSNQQSELPCVITLWLKHSLLHKMKPDIARNCWLYHSILTQK